MIIFTKFRKRKFNDKKAKNILSVSKQILTSYLKPKMLHLDIGWKFRNKVIQNCLKENNIDYIIEGHYNSQHQGAVESFNKAIKIFDISQGSSRKFFRLILLRFPNIL